MSTMLTDTPDVATALRQPRGVERLVTGQATRDGAGVHLTRLLAQPLQRRLDPFLMLDAFGSDVADDYIAGFPDHPHRGFETVTYMIAGRMRHRDSAGHEGLLQDGGLQWMTTGRGLVHSELPEQTEGRMEGFQLWVNLPGRDKLCAPSYRDIPAAAIPEWRAAGVTARVLAGATHGVAGAVRKDATQVTYLDLDLAPGAAFEQPLAATHNAFVVVFRGALDVVDADGAVTVPRERLAILRNDPAADGVRLVAGADGARALLIAGQPLGEPIAQYGPFVMNTQAELVQAVEDFRAGRFGVATAA